MRILHILNELRPSGAEVMLRTSADLWQEQGVEGVILATGDQVGSFTPALTEAGFVVHHLPFTPSASFLRAVRRLLIDGEYDVAHIHTERASFWYGLTARSVPGLSVIRTVHNVFAFRGYLRIKRLIQRNLLRAADVRTISVGAVVASNEQRRFKHPTSYIPNWVDTTRFAPPDPDRRSAARRTFDVDGPRRLAFVSVGNCNAAKNHTATLRALGSLGDDADWVYLHAGEEDPQQSERALAAELGIADRCRFLGFVPDVVSLLHAGDVYVMPSLHEGVGNAALKALATGLPCVLAATPGLEDLRQTIPEGIVWVEPTAESVRDGLVEASMLAATDRSDHRAARHRLVQEAHGLTVGPDRYLEVYRQATTQAAARRPQSRSNRTLAGPR